MSFVNKVVIVTGASAGIGRAAVVQFAKEGADVALVGRNEIRLTEVAEECAKYGKNPLVIKADLSKDDEVETVITRTIKTFGKLDVLVNNAAYFSPDDILKANFMETFDSMINLNVRSVVLITHLAAPHLIETKGNIVNVSSISATMVKPPNFVSFKTSKAGLNHFTRCIALELAPYGVRANIVSPGPVDTEIFEKAGLGNILPELQAGTALKRLGEPEDIANVTLFLASDKAKSVTGSDYVSDNGMLLM